MSCCRKSGRSPPPPAKFWPPCRPKIITISRARNACPAWSWRPTSRWRKPSSCGASSTANFDWKQQEFANPAAVLAWYDQTIPALIEELAALPAEKLAQPVAFHTMNYPAVHYLIMNLKHGIHHRGQLSSYLRPMGAKVPSIYGGSADEPMTAAAAE